MRMTMASIYRDSEVNIQRTSERILEFQRQLASGKRVERPSDDPSAAAGAVRARSELDSLEQYTRVADSASSRLTLIDTILTDVVNKLEYAQTTALSARGAGKTDAQRESAAQQLEGVRQALFENLNTSFNGAYVFGGADVLAPPYVRNGDGSISAYQGSTTEVRVDIDNGRTVTTNVDGSTVSQGTAPDDVFAVLDDLIIAVRAGDNDDIGTGLQALDAAFDRATTAQSRLGGDMATVDTQRTSLQQLQTAARTRLANLEDADFVQAATGMTQADAAYRAALQSTSQIARNSLMDYLS